MSKEKTQEELTIPVDLLDKDPLELAESEEDIQRWQVKESQVNQQELNLNNTKKT